MTSSYKASLTLLFWPSNKAKFEHGIFFLAFLFQPFSFKYFLYDELISWFWIPPPKKNVNKTFLVKFSDSSLSKNCSRFCIPKSYFEFFFYYWNKLTLSQINKYIWYLASFLDKEMHMRERANKHATRPS